MRPDREFRALRRTWPSLVTAAGLASGSRVPELTGVVRDETGFRVGVILLPGQYVDQYTAAATRIARAWGCDRVEASAPFAGRVILRARRTDPLATSVLTSLVTRDRSPGQHVDQPCDRYRLAVDLDTLTAGDPFPVVIARSGIPIEVSFADSAHLLIAGTTRSGKSICGNTLLTHAAVRRDVRTYIADPNAVAAAPWYRTAHRVTLDTHPAAATDLLREIRTEMEARKHLLIRQRTDRLTTFTEELPVLLVVFDELANYTRHSDKKAAEEFQTELIAVASQGAKFGVRLVAMTQKPGSDVLNTAIRANLTARICFRVEDVESYVMAFPEGRDLPITAADRTLPAGVAVVSIGSMRTPTLAKGIYTPTEACWAISDALCAAGRQLRDEQGGPDLTVAA